MSSYLEPPLEAVQPNAHVVTRLAAEFFLRGVDILGRRHSNDLVQCLIFTAIWTANIRHLTHSSSAQTPNTLLAVLPDEMRQPVSVLAISNSLRIPYETVRRTVNKLIQEGKCVRVPGKGVLVPGVVHADPENFQAVGQLYRTAQRLVAELKRAGLDNGDVR